MTQRIREWLTLVLVGVLPLHALLVTIGTKLIRGPGNAPFSVLALWKEGLLALILAIGFLEVLKNKKWMRLDKIDGLIIALGLLAIVIQATIACQDSFASPFLCNSFQYGIKYDFVPLIAFLILRRCTWSDWFKSSAIKVLLTVGCLVAGYGIISFFLPQSFFVWLGYSDLHSLYVANGPLAAFQQIGGTSLRRIQGTMSGPNQLGLWLLLPWSTAVVFWLREKVIGYWLLVIGLLGTGILLTFSRSAWIAATTIGAIALWMHLPRKQFKQVAIRYSLFAVCLFVIGAIFAPSLILRFASSKDHIARPLQAIHIIKENPLGLGLGTAGPASNRTSDTCVHLEAGADASWAADRPNLCVFVGEDQVQPKDRTCSCPVLPENWYLQIGVELGVLGMILFVALIATIIIHHSSLIIHSKDDSSLQRIAYLSLIGVSIAGLFLHSFEDAAVAYTVWLLTSACLRAKLHVSTKQSSHFTSF